MVLLLAGAFVGQMMHNLLLGTSWLAALKNCQTAMNEAGPSTSGAQELARSVLFLECSGPVERRRAMVALLGAAAVLALGLVGMWLLPWHLMRRAGPLTAAPRQWQLSAAALASAAGARRPPRVVWGSVWLAEPFTAGRPGRTWIVLPDGVGDLPPEQADAVLRHETAHVAAGDVTLVWLTRGVWWALPPVVLAPVLLTVLQNWDKGSIDALSILANAFWGEYAARVILLLIVAALVSQLILRSREHEADLRSVRDHDSRALEALLAAQSVTKPSWWGLAWATHPLPARRLAVLRRPGMIWRLTALDALATGMLAAMAVHAVFGIATPGFTGTPLGGKAQLASALVAGTLLAVGWGSALWQSILSGHGNGSAPRGALLALTAGMVLGSLAQLASTGTSAMGASGFWWTVATVPVATAAAGALSAALARLWAARRGDAHGRGRSWPGPLAANIALFTGALWIGQDSGHFLSAFGFVDAVVLGGLASPSKVPVALGLAAVAVLAAWSALRARSADRAHRTTLGRGIQQAPAWIPLFALVTAVAASTGAGAARWTGHPILGGGQPSYATQWDWWAAACAGGACALVLVVLQGSAGLETALYAAPLSTALTAATLCARHVETLADWPREALTYSGTSLSFLTFLLLAGALPTAFLPVLIPRRGRAFLLAPALAGLLAAATLVAVLHTGDRLVIDFPPQTAP
ncbi:M48 family metalloprotease [Streptomyces sp. NPDC058611]|uniref:M48 family metalloprotease n=2 Tax=Streptomyces TaxID=1883 RepID=UPI00365D06EE